MRNSERFAARGVNSVCLAGALLFAAALWAQPAKATETRTDLGNAAMSQEARNRTRDSLSDIRNIQAQLAENKLRDKFNAFDYTDELPPNLGFDEFEQSLEQRFFGTYVFYSKLTDEQRLQVYESYRRDQHISAIRTSTLDLLH